MKKETISNTILCKENDDKFFDNWFRFKEKKFVAHVDTLYFMVKPDSAYWKEDERKKRMFEVLHAVKKKADDTHQRVPVFENVYEGLETVPYAGLLMYSFNISLIDNFDIFICESPPNENTPPIMVQIRSQSLWINGIHKAFAMACDCLEKVLGAYGIKIESITENRIDYAFHTNYFQDLLNAFPERDLFNMQISNFVRWDKQGHFNNDEVYCDYFVLGRKKSNNVMLRVYNKTQEVIEKGYKQFFIAIWREQGLINEFDRWILERVFQNGGSYYSKDKERCIFYCMYGKDRTTRIEISDKLNDPDTPLGWFTKRAKGLVPDITTISNIEFETHRKFYDRLEIPENIVKDETYRCRMFNMFAQFSNFVNFLTTDIIRFVKYKGNYKNMNRNDRPNADWWERLRRTEPLEYTGTDLYPWIEGYFRKYQNDMDFERQKRGTIKKIARTSACMKFDCDVRPDINEDWTDILSRCNDNDLQDYKDTTSEKRSEYRKRNLIPEPSREEKSKTVYTKEDEISCHLQLAAYINSDEYKEFKQRSIEEYKERGELQKWMDSFVLLGQE